MRTPGHDLELVTGFLLTERVVDSLAEVEAVRHCTEAAPPEAEDNVVRVTLRAGRARRTSSALRRNLFASSSCGVCGKATLENALATAPPLDDPRALRAAVVCSRCPSGCARRSPCSTRRAASTPRRLFDATGRLLVAREDVGRHNAVDKVVGWAARAGRLPLAGRVLVVSGRTSFEIVQKALAARDPDRGGRVGARPRSRSRSPSARASRWSASCAAAASTCTARASASCPSLRRPADSAQQGGPTRRRPGARGSRAPRLKPAAARTDTHALTPPAGPPGR